MSCASMEAFTSSTVGSRSSQRESVPKTPDAFLRRQNAHAQGQRFVRLT